MNNKLNIEKCIKMLEEHHLPQEIIKHSIQVRNVALFLGQKLESKGESVNFDLLEHGALLHDIAKPISFNQLKFFEEDFESLDALSISEQNKLNSWMEKHKEHLDFWLSLKGTYDTTNHAKVGYHILKKDYPEIAKVVYKHQFFTAVEDGFDNIEQELISMADKHVQKTDIVTLKHRLNHIKKRYPAFILYKGENFFNDAINQINKSHQNIFKKVNLDESELKFEVEKALLSKEISIINY